MDKNRGVVKLPGYRLFQVLFILRMGRQNQERIEGHWELKNRNPRMVNV